MTNIIIEPAVSEWNQLIRRPQIDGEQLSAKVAEILEQVKLKGDEALRFYNKTFDKASIENLQVSNEEITQASSSISPALKNAIQFAAKNIKSFHESQIEKSVRLQTTPGVSCWRRSVGIETVGVYIPGGTAPLFSTLLMLAIPAQIAGCKNIIVCTPPDSNGNVAPAILYTASFLGISNIFKVGGAQAIGAMAFGTETVPAVNKIFGPGNQYVTLAKQLVNSKGIAIDMPAGPSELAVYADETSVASYVAADLLSQAEHGTDSQVLLVANSEELIGQVQKEIKQQLSTLPRKQIAAEALSNSRFIVLKQVEDAFTFLNRYAPEHLIIASDNAEALAEKVLNAGSVFLGNFSPEAAGDYASGTNHTLPTNGYASAYSGVSVDSFVKKITFQHLSKTGLQALASSIETMAEAEGLYAHKNAVSIRFNQ